MTDKTRVLVIDSSVVYRQFLAETLGNVPNVEVVGTAANGRIALARLNQVSVDMVLLDAGLGPKELTLTLTTLETDYPDVGIVPMTGLDSTDAEMVIRLLETGALELLTKPELGADQAARKDFQSRFESILRAFLGRKHVRLAKRLTEKRKETGKRDTQIEAMQKAARLALKTAMPRSAPIPRPAPGKAPSRIEAVLIGVSTGGPNALAEVIPKLDGRLGVPILLVQHMPPQFTQALAAGLDRRSALTVREAREGEPVLPNHVYIAPGGRHMAVRGPAGGNSPVSARIELNQDPPVNSCRPAADVLFASGCQVYDGRLLAVIMTGMGTDGAQGARLMKAKGGYILTQSEDTCVVYGMPRAVVEAGLSDEQVPLQDLAARIEALVKG